MMELILQALYSGMLVGGAYALVALGLALVFGTMKIINLAHGELVLLAAYIAYAAETRLQLNPLLAIPLALAVVCIGSALVYLLVDRIRQERELNSLILSYGIGIMLTNAILLIWKADVRSSANAWFQQALVLGPLYSMNSEALFFCISLALIGAVWLWLGRSWHGRALRAVAGNREAAKLMGVNPRKTELASFLLSGALATCAGVAIYSSGVIQPAMGHSLTVKAFVITVLAGTGSIPGVLLGALLLGIAESLTVTLFSSALQELAGMLLFLLVLFLMPNGLFGVKGRRG
ncbi:branched-chain amino acid ABC transporter [Chromobacterium sp. LK1]|uniref:branched-chain amino acid ABC transporter permease n=1 Tax=Chromobacterium sp. LK1 TaxID=1628193 RepID=UPI000654A78E|nr:branched-chain amino acid ABC transporter permease [Chromobacterium sp. LK1]KMN35628.1 branched-chain amino acid ABC transporter [Chromobacterium sp. LK1]